MRSIRQWVFISLATLAGCSADVPTLHIDLDACRVENYSLATVLKKNQQGELNPQAYDLMAVAPPHGVYFGVCGIDEQHGQSMLLVFSGKQDPQYPLTVTPPLFRGMSKAAVEELFGMPNITHSGKPYKKILLSGNQSGSQGRWAGLCPGFTMQFSFDQRARLTRLLILPVDTRAPTPRVIDPKK